MIELKAYQGLIRNHKELAEELGAEIAGCTRREREEKLIVAAYQAWGDRMGLHINGQFGVALYDSEADELFCARDILGAELLFYYVTADGDLLYGTQIRDLFDQPGFKRELNEELIQFYLGFSYVPGEETLFAGVNKLEPGGFLKFGKGGLQLGRYWELSFEPDETKTLDDWADEISDAMDASMASICDEGEEPDSFLSGGVDSSYMLAKSRAKTGYCVSYQNQEANEEDQARATAEYLGRGFEGIEVTPEDFFATLDEFLLAYEQPTSDAAGLALYCACKQVASRTKLCFSGEGADEFFAGYNGYQDAARFEKQSDPVYFGATRAMRDLDQKHYLKRFHKNRSESYFMRKRGAGGRKYDTVSWMLYVDLRSYFEGSILLNSTKIAQGTGLDIRMPFCDLRIFDIARRMPSRFKANAGENKIALRKAASRVLPDEVAYRKKLGFPVPIRDWLADPAYNGDIERAFKGEAAAKFFEPKELQALFGEFTGGKSNLWHKLRYRGNKTSLWRRVWSIYVFIRWYELFFEQSAK
ncbi:asparagine synthetase B family protein [Curtanaerobium respiraculi]|uniref:asparagine synthetase B family protein n=1 Tax=Curtanaerobium respiraculi TaxID=2949669 RepID=UPI0024B3602D|nr:asparagine synthase-related protein [Curtanaerobium respiraculi]